MVIYDFVVIIVLVFYILTILELFCKKKCPNVERPYKAFGYPVLPALYILISSAICLALFTQLHCGCVLIMLIGMQFII
jgi:APA family basic amino acid/polyamine antiporter